MKDLLKILIYLSFVLPFLFPRIAKAAVLRVPQDYATMEAAYDAASNGDEIVVTPGNYTVCLSSNRTKRIVLRAQNPATTSPAGQQTVLNSGCSHVIQFNTPLDNDGVFNQGEVVEFRGFVLRGSDDGFSYEEASGIVKDNIIYDQSDDPIDIDGESEARISGNILGRNGKGGGDGIENRLYNVSGSRDLLMIFMGNIIYNNPNDGIQLIDQTGSLTKRKYLIANNLIIGNGQAGIGTTQGGNSSQTETGYGLPEQIYVLHNTFVNNAWGGIIGGANMKVYNNIFYNNGKVALKNVGGNSVASNNLFFGNTTDYQGSNVQNPNILADPKFANTATPPDFSSYSLGSGSPAINAGRNVSSVYTEFGVTPPQVVGGAPDLGWKEYGGAIATPTPTQTPTGDCFPGVVPGDADGDCHVDGFDYVVWWQNFGTNITGYQYGDFDNNGAVDGFDYVIWWQNFGI